MIRPPSDRWAVVGAATLSWATFAKILLWNGHLLWPDQLGGLLDNQAVALMDGHLDIRDGSMSLEAFHMPSGVHSYFGLAPSLARIPLLWLAPSLRGQLTRLSLLIAFAGVCLALCRLVTAALPSDGLTSFRGWQRPAVAGASVIACACAGPMFAASRAWSYHEATLWSVAFALACLDAVLRATSRDHEVPPRRTYWLVAALFAVLAMHCRFSVGLGASIGVGLCAMWAIVTMTAPPDTNWWRSRLTHLMAIALIGCGLVAYAAVNSARFGSLFGVPIQNQAVANSKQFVDALAANGGTLFSPRYATTTLWSLLRPNGIGLRSSFPWLGLPAEPFVPKSGVILASSDRTNSITAIAPLVVLVALIGAALGVARVRRRGPVILFLILADLVGTAAVILIGYVATRYILDLVPLVVLGFVTGLGWLVRQRRPPLLSWIFGAVGALALIWSCVATVGTTMEYQRELGFGISDDAVRSWIDLKNEFGHLDLSRSNNFDSEAVPSPGALLIVGDCQALYQGNGDYWRQIEGTPLGGRLEVRFDRQVHIAAEPLLLAATQGEHRVEFLADLSDPDSLRLGLRMVAPPASGARAIAGAVAWTESQPRGQSSNEPWVLIVNPLAKFHSVRGPRNLQSGISDASIVDPFLVISPDLDNVASVNDPPTAVCTDLTDA